MTEAEPKLKLGDEVKAERVRYKPEDPVIVYTGKVVGVCYLFSEDGKAEEEYWYQVEFTEPDHSDDWFCEDDAVNDGIKYKWRK